MPTPRRVRPSLGPAAVSSCGGVAVLAFGFLVNGCRINKLLSRSAAESADGALQVSPATVHDSAIAGSTAPRSASLQVVHGGTWSARNDSPWIGLSPASGSGSRPLTLALHPQALGPGPHEGTVTVTAPDAAGSPVTVPSSLSPAADPDRAPDDTTALPARITVSSVTRSKSRTAAMAARVDGVEHEQMAHPGNGRRRRAGKIPLTMSSAGLPVGTYHDTVVVVAVARRQSRQDRSDVPQETRRLMPTPRKLPISRCRSLALLLLSVATCRSTCCSAFGGAQSRARRDTHAGARFRARRVGEDRRTNVKSRTATAATRVLDGGVRELSWSCSAPGRTRRTTRYHTGPR